MKGYDFLVLGAGGTGLASAMYAARLGLKTLVLGSSHGSELPIGGVITTTNSVENYPGFIRLTGFELARNIENHARSYDLVEIKDEKAEKIEKVKNGFSVKTKKGTYLSKTLLFATGTKRKELDKNLKIRVFIIVLFVTALFVKRRWLLLSVVLILLQKTLFFSQNAQKRSI
jgi:thioredoxin reductase (NADPH)